MVSLLKEFRCIKVGYIKCVGLVVVFQAPVLCSVVEGFHLQIVMSPDSICPLVLYRRHNVFIFCRCFCILHEINLLHMLSKHRHLVLSESLSWEQLSGLLFSELDKYG